MFRTTYCTKRLANNAIASQETVSFQSLTQAKVSLLPDLSDALHAMFAFSTDEYLQVCYNNENKLIFPRGVA